MYADGIDVVFFEEFSDAGAHIRNMAFYNLPLRMLKLVQESIEEGSPIMTMEQAVQRLLMTGKITREVAMSVISGSNQP